MRHPCWFVFVVITLELWAVHGLYHLSQQFGWTALELSLSPIFGQSLFGIQAHIVMEIFTGVGLLAFLVLLVAK